MCCLRVSEDLKTRQAEAPIFGASRKLEWRVGLGKGGSLKKAVGEIPKATWDICKAKIALLDSAPFPSIAVRPRTFCRFCDLGLRGILDLIACRGSKQSACAHRSVVSRLQRGGAELMSWCSMDSQQRPAAERFRQDFGVQGQGSSKREGSGGGMQAAVMSFLFPEHVTQDVSEATRWHQEYDFQQYYFQHLPLLH